MTEAAVDAPRKEIDVGRLVTLLKRQPGERRVEMTRALQLSPVVLERFIKAPDFDPLPYEMLEQVEGFVNGEYVLSNSTGHWIRKPLQAAPADYQIGNTASLTHRNENKETKEYGCPAEGKMGVRGPVRVEEVKNPGKKLDDKLTEARKKRQEEMANRANGKRHPVEKPKPGKVLSLPSFGRSDAGLG